MQKRVILTGGGSAGHVTVNLSLIPVLHERGWTIHYIGSKRGIERELVGQFPYVTYHPISTGKLRRYFDVQNALDVFRTAKGCGDALLLMRKIKPHVVFSKGGFVSVPVVLAASLCRVPVVTHESDYSPGLANRIAARYARKICLTFADTRRFLKTRAETIPIGAVVRPDIFTGSRRAGLESCGFSESKPVVLVVGGSLGAQSLNTALRAALQDMLSVFQVIHLCGKNNLDPAVTEKGYVQIEYAGESYPDLLAAADVVVSRAGSNAIFEFYALKKPMLLVPLPLGSSRGDQIENAERFMSAGIARVLTNEECGERIFSETMYLYKNAARYTEAMEKNAPRTDALDVLCDIITKNASAKPARD